MTDKKNNFAKDINVPRKEQIIIDGVTYYKQQDINEGLDEEHYITEFHLLATHYNLLLEDYARKTQECELLETQLESYHIGEPKLIQRIQELEQKCEELKKQLETSEKWRIESDLQNDRYRRALEKIEDFRKKHCDFLCEGNRILDIINKAKEEK